MYDIMIYNFAFEDIDLWPLQVRSNVEKAWKFKWLQQTSQKPQNSFSHIHKIENMNSFFYNL